MRKAKAGENPTVVESDIPFRNSIPLIFHNYGKNSNEISSTNIK